MLVKPGQPAIERHGDLGETTNNVAEYTALLEALKLAHAEGGKRLKIHSDSELMVRQMLGAFTRSKTPGCKSFTRTRLNWSRSSTRSISSTFAGNRISAPTRCATTCWTA